MRTQEEIKRQIDGLEAMKKWLPEHSTFGNDNWGRIDAQIEVLNGGKDADDFYQDESNEEFEDGDNDIWNAANDAESWLDGSRTQDLFEEKSK